MPNEQGQSARFALFLIATYCFAVLSCAGNIQSQFDHLVGTADRLYAEKANTPAAVAVIRAALLVCANCTASNSKGHFSERVFIFDDLEDRKYLSESLFPALTMHKPKEVLWVGVQPYTLKAVYQLEALEAEVTTIEPDPEQSLYGSSTRHIVAPLQKLAAHVPLPSFDAIVINGVIGWGIDGEEAVRDAARIMSDSLRDGGVLIVGWNKGMGTCCSLDPWFNPHRLQNLPTVYEVPGSETQHIFETFRKSSRVSTGSGSGWGDT